jgi:hypothetical protein
MSPLSSPAAVATPPDPPTTPTPPLKKPRGNPTLHLAPRRGARSRVAVAADRYQDFLPPAFVVRLHDYPPELMAPHFPTRGVTAAQDHMRRRAVAAALAPWRRAIADASAAARAARKKAAAARAAAPNVPRAHGPPPDAAGPARRASGRTPSTRARPRRAQYQRARTPCTISAS